MIKKYVLGFAFVPGCDQVLLIRKTRPEWQKGKYNGLGGSIEEGENIYEAMEREFREEANVLVDKSKWDFVTKIVGKTCIVFVLKTVLKQEEVNKIDYEAFESDEGPVHFLSTIQISYDTRVLDNVKFLIPMCIIKTEVPFELTY